MHVYLERSRQSAALALVGSAKTVSVGAAASEQMRGRHGNVSVRCQRDLLQLMRTISEEENIQNIYVRNTYCLFYGRDINTRHLFLTSKRCRE